MANYKTILNLLGLIGIFFFAPQTSKAAVHWPQYQNNNPSSTITLSDSNVFLLQNSTLILWNPYTLEQLPYMSLVQQHTDVVRQVAKNPNSETLYVVIGTRSQQSSSSSSEVDNIIQINLLTQERKSVFQKNDIQGFILSPNGQKAIVTYLRNGPDSLLGFCILDTVENACPENNIGLDAGITHWIDNTTFVTLFKDDFKLHEVDTTSMASTLLQGLDNWFIYGVTPIPTTNKLLVGAVKQNQATLEAGTFLVYDLGLSQLLDWPYSKTLEQDVYSTISDIKFNTDGAYFFYAYGVSEHGFKYKIVNFQTGEVISDLSNIRQIEWLPNSVIANVVSSSDGNIIKVTNLNVKSKISI